MIAGWDVNSKKFSNGEIENKTHHLAVNADSQVVIMKTLDEAQEWFRGETHEFGDLGDCRYPLARYERFMPEKMKILNKETGAYDFPCGDYFFLRTPISDNCKLVL